MSSWERARRIPWSQIDQTVDTNDVTSYREKVHRKIQRQRHRMEDEKAKLLQESSSNGSTDDKAAAVVMTDSTGIVQQQQIMNKKQQSSEKEAVPTLTRIRETYRTWDLCKHTGFGAVLGSLTGGVFGLMDSMRQMGDSALLKKASTGAKTKFLLQGTTRSGALFGAFFGGFHAVKYGTEVIAEPGEYTQIAVAGMISCGALMYKPALRSSLPYAGMLIGMEAFNVFMRDQQ